jgi:hypothetical protein
MTRDDWLTCSDPTVMLNFLRDTATGRKLRLFACAWGRDVWRHLSDERSRDAIFTAERFADGEVTFAELLAAHRDAADVCLAISLTPGRRRDSITRRQADRNWGAKASAEVARHAADPEWDARTAACAVAWKKGAIRYAMSNHLRDIFNPFRSVSIEPAWLTSTVLALARYAYDSGDFSAMPILADALQDASCDNADILDHCRGEGPHVRGCWVVDLVLGKE